MSNRRVQGMNYLLSLTIVGVCEKVTVRASPESRGTALPVEVKSAVEFLAI